MSLDQKRPVYKDVYEKYGKHFCIAPWTCLYVSTSGGMSPCCKVKPFITRNQETHVSDYHNHPELKKLRQQFLNGEKPSVCDDCWQREETSGSKPGQLRWSLNNSIPDALLLKQLDSTLPDGTIINSEQTFTYMDICWTNKCNFACLSCAPGASSTIQKTAHDVADIIWGQDMSNQYIGGQAQQMKEYVEEYGLNNLNKIHLSGGEPFMQEDIFDFLELMLEKGYDKNVHLAMHTNGSVSKDYKGVDIVETYFKKWRNKVTVTMSIDHCGEKGAYLRPGYKDEIWLNNFHKYYQAGLRVECQTTIGLLNTPTLYELSDFFKKNLPVYNAKIGVIQNPNSMALGNINLFPDLKQKSLSSMMSFIKLNIPASNRHYNIKVWRAIKDTLKGMRSYPNALQSLKQGIELNDKKRNKNFLDIFPEHSNMWQKLLTDVPDPIII